MLEPYAGKLACTVLRGGGSGNRAPLPDRPESEGEAMSDKQNTDYVTRRGVLFLLGMTWLFISLAFGRIGMPDVLSNRIVDVGLWAVSFAVALVMLGSFWFSGRAKT